MCYESMRGHTFAELFTELLIPALFTRLSRVNRYTGDEKTVAAYVHWSDKSKIVI